MEKWIILNPPYNEYAVSNLGNVKNIKRNKNIKQFEKYDGYMQVSLWKDNKGKSHTVHRLVALYHIDNFHNKLYVNHKDGNKSNNLVSNLEWVTPSENNYHAVENGLVNAMPISITDLKSNTVYTFPSITQGAEFINIDKRLISRALKRKNGEVHGYKIVRI